MRRLGQLLAAGAAVCAFLVPAGASAAQWELTQLSGQPTLFGMSCPVPTLCVTVGNNNSVASSTDPTGGAGAWSFVFPGSGAVWQTNNGAYNGAQIRGISCPSTSLCVSVSLDGFIYSTTDPTGPASAWNTVDISKKGPNTHMYGVSCPTPSMCVAVAFGGRIITTTNPTGGETAWTTTQLPQALQLSAVSCPSVSLCVAVSRDGAIVSSTDPTGGPGAWQVVAEPTFEQLFGVSCASPSLCVTANASDFLSATGPTGDGSAWALAPGVTPLQVMAVSCTPTGACAAVDNNADAFTSLNPTAGAKGWSFVNALPYTAANGTFGISCPTQEFCAVAAANGQVVTSTDPFGGESTKAKLPQGKHQRRPTVKLTHHPHARVMTSGAKARVFFRFREIGVRKGFLCKLDGAKFRRCRSPKAYSVGPGRHTFRVKTYDPGGFDQTVTKFRFAVIRLATH